MEDKVLKAVAVLMVALTLVVTLSMFRFPNMHEAYATALENYENMSVDNIFYSPEDVLKDSADAKGKLKIEIPSGVGEDGYSVQNDYQSQTVLISFDGLKEDYFENYSISGSPEHVASLSTYTQGESTVLAIAMDKLYEIDYSYSDGQLYLGFTDPHDIYDKIIVVDAGHGGRMTGAVKNGVQEKDLNLAIVEELKTLLDANDQNIGVYYTRLDDSNPSLYQRAAMANKVDADLFISVHINSSKSGKFSSLSGTQVLYSQSDDSEYSSQRLATICLDEVTAVTGSRRIGLLEADDIYIIRSSKVPVALVEVGFISNREELELLQTVEYQQSIAQGLYNSIMRAFEEGY